MCIRDRPLIEHLNLCVEPGQTVAIVGPTGAGKTTLVNLITVSYTHLRAHETVLDLVCRLLLEKKTYYNDISRPTSTLPAYYTNNECSPQLHQYI